VHRLGIGGEVVARKGDRLQAFSALRELEAVAVVSCDAVLVDLEADAPVGNDPRREVGGADGDVVDALENGPAPP
jgi:hypothetical protein